MRVRAKSARLGVPVEHLVLEESVSFYITVYKEVLPKCDYEPVPTERWVDVTAQCDVYVSGDWLSIKHANADLSIHGDSYRFRKIRVLPTQWAFIVEKKEAV